MVNSLTGYLKFIIAQYKIYLSSLFCIAIMASFFEISVNYKIKQIIDTIGSGSNVHILVALFIFFKLMQHGMFFIVRLLDIKYKPGLITKITNDIYIKTIGHSLHWFDSHLSGEIANKIITFQTSLTELITRCFRSLVVLWSIIIGMIFLFKVNALSAGVVLLFAIIYSPIISILLKKQMRLQEQYARANQETSGIINDSIANIFGIKVIGNVLSEFKLKLTPSLLYRQEWDKKTRKFDAYFVDNADTIMVTLMSATQICLLSFLYHHGQITAGSFAFIAMITLKIHSDLDQLLESLLFYINPAIANMKASYSFVNCNYDIEDKSDAKTLVNVEGEIKFNNIDFSYDKGREVLHNFTLHIPANQKIGIVGTSGAGKTTLIKCLLRYFDIKSGDILIDGTSIQNITQESLRANISVIPQDITMFHRTILENLQLAKYDATLNEIMEACKKARIHDDIMNMEKGYDSVVGERGVKVSGGQRQRIAIARSILKNAPILILDEATSSLDTATEQLIQKSLNEVIKVNNATVIAIAHRLSTLKHMDRIIVLDKGQIIEEGTHDQLMSNNSSAYKKLWDMQCI